MNRDLHFAKAVESATVRLTRLDGRGVIVPGNYIVTAAHCIGWTAEGLMAIDGRGESPEPVSWHGRDLWADVYAIEPVADIAILGPPDAQTFPEEWDVFMEVFDAVSPVPLATAPLEVWREFPAFILSHDKGWIEGKAKACREGAHRLMLKAAEKIERGTSGSPVVDESGRLLGVISCSDNPVGPQEATGLMPFAHRALPRWVVDDIIAATGDPENPLRKAAFTPSSQM